MAEDALVTVRQAATDEAARAVAVVLVERGIGATVVRSRYSGVPPWDALAELATQQGLPDLDDLADTLRLAGEEGAQVFATLKARSSALRNAITTADRAEVNARSDRLMLPTLVMAAAFIGVVIMAAIFRILAA